MSNEFLVKAILETKDEVLAWASSPLNDGPFQEDAYRISVHVSGMLQILANKLMEQDGK